MATIGPGLESQCSRTHLSCMSLALQSLHKTTHARVHPPTLSAGNQGEDPGGDRDDLESPIICWCKLYGSFCPQRAVNSRSLKPVACPRLPLFVLVFARVFAFRPWPRRRVPRSLCSTTILMSLCPLILPVCRHARARWQPLHLSFSGPQNSLSWHC